MQFHGNIEKIKAVSIQEVLKEPELTRLVLSTYVYLFDCKNPLFCTRSITNYYNQILQNGLKNLNLKTMERKYILKSGVEIYDAENYTYYNSVSITDKIAKDLIKRNPRIASQFEKIPAVSEKSEIIKEKKSRKTKI